MLILVAALLIVYISIWKVVWHIRLLSVQLSIEQLLVGVWRCRQNIGAGMIEN